MLPSGIGYTCNDIVFPLIQVAWATNKGVKESSFKDAWDVDNGVTYIPYSRLPDTLDLLYEGGMVDEDTVPDYLRG
jgi:hypothetical protein